MANYCRAVIKSLRGTIWVLNIAEFYYDFESVEKAATDFPIKKI
jgi:hypothetical protein